MATNMPAADAEEVYTISTKPGITPILDMPSTDGIPTGQVRVIDNGPAKPTGPKKGFAK